MEKKKRPGYLKQYAEHAKISRQAAREQLERVGIDYMQPFDFSDADRKREAARHADRAQFAKPIYAEGERTDETDVDEQTKKDPKFVESQARREMFKAKLTELEYLERVGALVRKDKVEEEAFRKWRIARDKLLNVVNRIYNDLAMQSDPMKVKAQLLREIRQALESIATGTDPWKDVA